MVSQIKQGDHATWAITPHVSLAGPRHPALAVVLRFRQPQHDGHGPQVSHVPGDLRPHLRGRLNLPTLLHDDELDPLS